MGRNRGGRPPLEMPVVRLKLTLSLRVGEDDDLIAWFDAIPRGERARRVKAALRQGGATFTEPIVPGEEVVDDATLAALLDAL